MQKLWSLQVLRFVAALMVVHLHASHHWHPVMIGRAGVDVFFVLSGLIMARTALQPGMDSAEFLQKRLRRILPLYALMTLPWVIVADIGGELTARRWLASAFWPATDVMATPLHPVAWTLCFEMLFYAALALILWRRWTIWPVLGLFTASLVLRNTPLTQFLGNPIIFEFLVGIAIAYLPPIRAAVWGIPVGVGVLIAGAVLGWPPYGETLSNLVGDEAWIRLLTLGVPSALIVLGVLQLQAKESVWTYLGDASYSLYLVHPLVLLFLTPLPLGWTIVPLGIGLSLLAAWRVHEIFEKPLVRRLALSEATAQRQA